MFLYVVFIYIYIYKQYKIICIYIDKCCRLWYMNRVCIIIIFSLYYWSYYKVLLTNRGRFLFMPSWFLVPTLCLYSEDRRLDILLMIDDSVPWHKTWDFLPCFYSVIVWFPWMDRAAQQRPCQATFTSDTVHLNALYLWWRTFSCIKSYIVIIVAVYGTLHGCCYDLFLINKLMSRLILILFEPWCGKNVYVYLSKFCFIFSYKTPSLACF